MIKETERMSCTYFYVIYKKKKNNNNEGKKHSQMINKNRDCSLSLK